MREVFSWGGAFPSIVFEAAGTASPVADPTSSARRVADSHPKDDPLLGDTLAPARDPSTDPQLESTHHSGERSDPTNSSKALDKGTALDR